MTNWSRRGLLGAGLALGVPGRGWAAASSLKPLPRQPLPPVVDHSALFGPVKNQGEYRQTCAYFALTALIEAELARHTGWFRSLSEQYLTDLAHAGKRPPADESTTLVHVLHLVSENGMVPADALPYRNTLALDQPVLPPTPAVLAQKIRLDIDPKAVRGFSKLLPRLAQGPLIMPLPSSNNWAGWHDEDGLFEPLDVHVPREGGTNHFVVFTGYDMRQQVFFFRSSWGPKWGRGGYGRVSFDSMRTRLSSIYAIFVNRFAVI